MGIKEVDNGIWLVSFMDYDLGYFDLEGKRFEPLENPFRAKVHSVTYVSVWARVHWSREWELNPRPAHYE